MRKYTFIALMLACLPMLCMGQSTLSLSITGYDARCNGSLGGSAKVTPSGGVAPYSYSWAPAAGVTDSVSGLAAGIYSVTVTDSLGHTASGSVTISQPAPLVVSIDSIVVFPCFRTTVAVCGCNNTLWAIVSGGTAPYSYLWSPGGDTGDTLLHACYQEFTVNVTDNNNCVTTDSINVVIPTFFVPVIAAAGVAQVSNTNGINTYPNPAGNQLNISIGQSAAAVSNLAVYDMMGTKVAELQPGSNERLITIDVSRLANGNYLLKVISNDQSQQTIPFSISR